MKTLAATKSQANTIARLIMQAMNYDCCLYFMGTNYTLDDFEQTMTKLVKSDNSQYSYQNTITALDDDERLCGICVSYDGGKLHQLRKAFVSAMKDNFGRDFSNMEDETTKGELYIDSLAVEEHSRRKGFATALIKATIEKAKTMKMPAVGLLVDQGNPEAEKLYQRIGFEFVNETTWGGHPMKHLQYKINKRDF